jgi:hypothetical protein
VPVLKKQAYATVDTATTMVCLDVAGQIRDLDEPFDTLAGLFLSPPFHIHCRTVVLPYAAGVIRVQRAVANAEIRRRPLGEKRKGPAGYEGPIPPPPPVGTPPQVLRPRPPRVPAESTRVTPKHHGPLTVWLPHVARLRRTPPGAGDRVLVAIATVQGTAGLPRVVSGAELSRLVAEGAAELWRGHTSPAHTEQLLTGPLLAGLEIYGNGLYFVTSKQAAARFAGPDGDVVRAALAPAARIIAWADLEILMKDTADRLTAGQRRRLTVLLEDPGRFAAAMGYDAVLLPNGDVLVVNRTALVVAR